MASHLTRKFFRAVFLCAIVLAAGVILFKVLMPLPLPIARKGQVVDATTNKPIPTAVLETRWTIYDFPMLDGEGSYEVSSLTTTGANGQFTLNVPDHRRGLWNTEMYPPIVRADGYQPFTLGDWNGFSWGNGLLTIPLKPEPAPARSPTLPHTSDPSQK